MNRLNFRVDNNVTLSTIIHGSLPVDFILVHGLASNARLWDGVGEFLLDQGKSSIAIDLRGHGLSSKPADGYTHDQITRDIEIIAQRVVDLQAKKRVVLVGQSWGAALVTDFAVRFPQYVAGLVLVDGGYSDLKSRFPSWSECQTLLKPPDLSGLRFADAKRFIQTAHPTWSQTALDASIANLEELGDGKVRARLSLANHMAILHELYDYTPLTSLGKLTIPIRILVAQSKHNSGDSSIISEIEQVNQLVNLRLDIFENGDHDLHAQFPNLVGQAALDEIESY